MNNIKKLTLFIAVLFIAACSSDKETESDIKVASIGISNATAITDGKAKQLTAVVLPSIATDKTVTWSVSDPTIAAITQTGMLTPLKNGTVSVDVTANDGSGIAKQVTIVITGVQGPVVLATSVTISGTNITDGKPQQLTVAISPVDATNKTVTWSVSDIAIATISADGLLTPIANGTITVYATAKDGSGKVGSIQLPISGVTIVYATKVRSESILIWQRSNGGWGKAVPELDDYNLVQTDAQKAAAASSKNNTDTTIDNGHVTTELRWLLADYKTTKNPAYLAAAQKAIDYLFLAQYANGGWPQYYPDKSGYRHQITYNDDAIVKVMNVMWDISKKQKDLEQVDAKYIPLSVTAFNKGIDIMLKTQITINGKKTAWCAQHDEITLKPALARSYELPSISGSESVGITSTLMLVENPSAEIKQAVKGAMEWFDSAKILDIKTEKTSTNPVDVIVVASPGNVLWARFYDLDTGLPFFCARDGVKKNTLADVDDIERRAGYAWYGNWPSKITSAYATWKSKHGLQ